MIKTGFRKYVSILGDAFKKKQSESGCSEIPNDHTLTTEIKKQPEINQVDEIQVTSVKIKTNIRPPKHFKNHIDQRDIWQVMKKIHEKREMSLFETNLILGNIILR